MRAGSGGPTVRSMATRQGAPGGFAVRRVYEEPGDGDGRRVLVDRLWPRGISKERARLDEWPKELAPSDGLRRWMHEDKDGRYGEFARRYRAELRAEEPAAALDRLREDAARSTVTLVTGVKDVEHSHVPVLLEALRRT